MVDPGRPRVGHSAGSQRGGPRSGLDYRALTFAIGLSILTGIFFGLAPALRATRAGVETTHKDQGASVSSGVLNVRLRKCLLVSQVVLLIAAGLFARSLINLRRLDLGVRTDYVLQFSIAPALSRYSPPQTIAFFDHLCEGLAALPGVRSVSAAQVPVFADDDSGADITAEGYDAKPDENTHVLENWIGPDDFATMGTPLLAGREFRENDAAAR